MEKLINEYYEIIKEDNEYLKKYILNIELESQEHLDVKNIIEKLFEWRKIQNVQELEQKIRNKKIKDLLGVEDYYVDELRELLREHLTITDKTFNYRKYFSNRNLNELLTNEKTPQRIKDCIKIYLKTNNVCEKLYEKYKLGEC